MLKNRNLIVMLTYFYANAVTMIGMYSKHSKMIMFNHRYLKNGLILNRLVYCFDFILIIIIFYEKY